MFPLKDVPRASAPLLLAAAVALAAPVAAAPAPPTEPPPPAAAPAGAPAAPSLAEPHAPPLALPDSLLGPGAETVLVDRIVAIVDEEAILQSDLERETELYHLERQYAGQPDDQPADEVRKEVLQRLVESKLIIAAAKQADITVDDEAVAKEVDARVKQLQDHFGSAEALRRELRGSGMTMEDYRARLSSQLRDQEYLRGVVGRFLRPKVEVLENEISDYYRDHQDEMPATSDSLTLADILVPVQPDPGRRVEVQRRVAAALADLKAGGDFAAVARKHGDPDVAVSAVVKRGDLYDPTLEQAVWTLSEGEVSQPILTRRGVHLVRLDRVTDEGSRAISQMFFSLEVTEKDVETARRAADAAYERLRQGEPFARVAAEASADPASAKRGGELGTFPLDDLSPAFQEALRDRKAGELTAPVPTPAGFYIFRVERRTEGRVLPFDQVKDSLRRTLESQKLEKELEKYIASLRERYHIDLKI